MTVGTKSLLFGVHQVFLHPVLVALAWIRLYGFPLDPRIWVAFVVHDWGYWGRRNMDGPHDGELHPYLGARLMGFLFGPEWYRFALFHSRFLASRHAEPFSRLCVADKLAIAYYPIWLYLFLGNVSGEIVEYQRGRTPFPGSQRDWLRFLQKTMVRWAIKNRSYPNNEKV